MPTDIITAIQVRSLFDYNPETGIFTSKKNGSTVGVKHSKGYLTTHIGTCHKYLHRIAWLHVHGELPDGQIDHINGIKTDNRIANLRVVTNSQNHQNNTKAMPFNTTGMLGVCRKRNKFAARIKVNGKIMSLGSFHTKEEASEAYWEAKRRLHSHCPEG